MRGKEFIKTLFMSFFIIVTLVNVATYILGITLQPEIQFGYEALLSPLIYGFFGVLPFAIMYSNRELSVRQLLIRKSVQLLLIEVLLLYISFGGGMFDPSNTRLAMPLAGSILIIYVLVNLILWLLDLNTAKSLTNELIDFQKNHNEADISVSDD